MASDHRPNRGFDPRVGRSVPPWQQGPPPPGPPPGGFPPPSEPVPEPPLDLAERLAARRERFTERRPRLSRFLRRAYTLATWASIPILLLNLVFVPETRDSLPVLLGVFTLALQLALLTRSRSVSISGYLKTVVAATLWAVVIVGLQLPLIAALGWDVRGTEAVVWIAGPTEEVLKLVPLLAVLWFARNRAARFGVVDHVLLGAACGAGFALAENSVRGLVYQQGPLARILAELSGGTAGHQYSLFTLFPGWTASGDAEWAGHAVVTALVGAGIGLVRRYRTVLLWPVPLALLAWACLDHMAWNEGATNAGQLPDALLLAHVLTGSGQLARPALLALILLAVYLDYRTLSRVHATLPPLPPSGSNPGASPLAALATVGVELRLQWRALRRSPQAFGQAMAFVRGHRELGYGLHRAAGRPRRDAPRWDLMWQTGSMLHNAVTAAAVAALVLASVPLVAALTGPTPEQAAFIAPIFDRLGDFWNTLTPGQQILLTLGGTAALMLVPGVGFFAALGAATTVTGIAGSGRDIANAIRDNAPGALLAQLAMAVVAGRLRPLTVVKVNGRWPINSHWAGKVFNGPTWTPALRTKYPNGVKFNAQGFPDFSPYATQTVRVQNLTGAYNKDARLANSAAGIRRTPYGYTWNHVEDGTTMQLVPTDIHSAVRHTGGAAYIRGNQP